MEMKSTPDTTVWRHWKKVKIAVCALGGVQSAAVPPSELLSIRWVDAAIMVVVAPLVVVLVAGLQSANPASERQWRRPTWNANPFNLGQPLSFFHLAGWFFFAGGLGLTIPAIRTGPQLLAAPLLLLCVGIGTLTGVRLCEMVFRWKFTRSGASA